MYCRAGQGRAGQGRAGQGRAGLHLNNEQGLQELMGCHGWQDGAAGSDSVAAVQLSSGLAGPLPTDVERGPVMACTPSKRFESRNAKLLESS